MQKVVGIGGIFFKSKDPAALRNWYAEHLGIPLSDWGHMFEESGPVVWSPTAEDTDYFAPSTKEFMINYRVEDMDAMVEQLRQAGVVVDEKDGDHEYGRFAWASDPEGNKFELWQPPADSGSE